ncbi:unnamed protein product [Camellia sinensis]
MLGYEGMDVINPEGGKDDAEEEAQRGRWKQEGNSKRRAILLGVGALALSSCLASSLFAEEIPQNYEAFVNKSDGYSYYYPSDWRMGALNDHLLPFNEEPSVNDSTLKSKGSTSSAE